MCVCVCVTVFVYMSFNNFKKIAHEIAGGIFRLVWCFVLDFPRDFPNSGEKKNREYLFITVSVIFEFFFFFTHFSIF